MSRTRFAEKDFHRGGVKMLEILYHIHYEDIAPSNEETQEVETPTTDSQISDLYELIYKAVFNANIDAREEWSKRRRGN